MLSLQRHFENKNYESNILTVFRIGIHTLVHQTNNVAFKRFDMSGW